MKITSPLFGWKTPQITLIRVRFPEPIGPMTPNISPSSTSKLRLLSALTPPKCFEIDFICKKKVRNVCTVKNKKLVKTLRQ